MPYLWGAMLIIAGLTLLIAGAQGNAAALLGAVTGRPADLALGTANAYPHAVAGGSTPMVPHP